MAEISDQLMLPLRPSFAKDQSTDNLRAKITQINEQRGLFRDITEESLLEEISANHTAEEENLVDKDAEVEDDQENRLEKLYKGREEILRQVNVARNEAYSALDFISLLLTKQNSRQAETSMSPFLKANIPLGTIDSQKAKTSGPSAAEKRKTELVSNGWKVESFSTSAERLLDASTRLQKEAARESKYWEQLSRIKAEGWGVSKVPQERHTLGVRFGFAEATPAFRNRGFAALRSREDGKLYLDKGAASSKNRAIQVAIFEKDQQIRASIVPADTSADSDAIEEEILQARNSLFEEELFHEANREARASASLGFSTGHNLIRFDLNQSRKVELRLVKLQETTDVPPAEWTSNHTAEIIALALRLLLTRAHRKNHEKRTKPPPPMTTRPRPTPEYLLLRPVMALMQHREYLQGFCGAMEEKLKCLRVAGFSASSQESAFENLTASQNSALESTSELVWIESLTKPLESTVKVELPSSQNLEVKIQSFLGPPIWGTAFQVSEVKWHSIRLPQSRHTALEECRTSMSQILLQDSISTIEAISIPSVEGSSKSSLHWESERPFSSTFFARVGGVSSKSQLQFQFAPSGLLLRYVLVNSSNTPHSLCTYVWMKNGQVKKESNGKREEIPGLTLKQVVEESLKTLRSLL